MSELAHFTFKESVSSGEQKGYDSLDCLGDDLKELDHGAHIGDSGEDLKGVVIIADAYISDEDTNGSLGTVSFLAQTREVYQDKASHRSITP